MSGIEKAYVHFYFTFLIAKKIVVNVSILLCYRVIESKNKDCAVGDYVTGMFGWRTHTIVTPKDPKEDGSPGYVKVDASVPRDKLSLALGVLGMPG